ncbi:MAG: N-acetyl-D-glucosamine ABC transporter, permease protein 1, partial [uncultured Thermomicrobiales bacterium]
GDFGDRYRGDLRPGNAVGRQPVEIAALTLRRALGPVLHRPTAPRAPRLFGDPGRLGDDPQLHGVGWPRRSHLRGTRKLPRDVPEQRVPRRPVAHDPVHGHLGPGQRHRLPADRAPSQQRQVQDDLPSDLLPANRDEFRSDLLGLALGTERRLRPDQYLSPKLVRGRPAKLAHRAGPRSPDHRPGLDLGQHRLQHGDLPGRAAEHLSLVPRGGADRRSVPGAPVLQHHLAAALPNGLLRHDHLVDRGLPDLRPGLRHDGWWSGQRQFNHGPLHLRDGLRRLQLRAKRGGRDGPLRHYPPGHPVPVLGPAAVGALRRL